jgi:hypothetical protein
MVFLVTAISIEGLAFHSTVSETYIHRNDVDKTFSTKRPVPIVKYYVMAAAVLLFA